MQSQVEARLKEMGSLNLLDISYFGKYYELAVSGLTLEEIIREENQDELTEVIRVFNEEREKIITHFTVESIRKYRKALGIEYDDMKFGGQAKIWCSENRRIILPSVARNRRMADFGIRES